MILLKTLTWSNVFSYGENNRISFVDEPLVQLVGVNGAGKSSIPLILEEIIFNKNSKGIKKGFILNRLVKTNKYSINLSFTKDDVDEYEIDLTRSGNTQKVKLLKNGADISSHTATGTFSQIEELFGSDFKTFAPLIYQSSTSSLQFLTATDTGRKNFLIELLNLKKYVEIFEKIKVVHKSVSDKLLQSQTQFNTIKSWLDKYSSMDLTEQPVVEVPPLPTEVAVQISELQKRAMEVDNLNKRINENNTFINMRDAIDISQVASGPQQELDTKDLVSKSAILKSEIKHLNILVKQLQGLHGACPNCMQPINETIKYDMVEKAKADIREREVALDTVSAELTKTEQVNNTVRKNKSLIASFEAYSAKIDNSLPKMVVEREDLLKDISELTERLNKAKALIDAANKANTTAIKHNASIATISQQIDAYTSQLSESTEVLETMEHELSVLNVLKKAFSTNGLIAYKIENSVQDLQEITNEYLSELSDGRFQLTFDINNDKLNVVIVDEGNEIEITALSAGELARVNTSTLLAIRKLMSTLSKSRINVLFLDETIDNLDSFGKERLIEVLSKEVYLNTFLISHGYTHPLLKKIEVVKENGISRIED